MDSMILCVRGLFRSGEPTIPDASMNSMNLLANLK